MNMKLSLSLIAITSALYGCSATPNISGPIVSNPVITENGDKVTGDGSHLLGLPMTRDFIMDTSAYTSEANANYEKARIKVSEKISSGQKTTDYLPDRKIFSIKPVGDVKPRAVILLKPVDIENIRTWTVRKKNITVCEGFMTLPTATSDGSLGSQQVRDNEVITFMPVKKSIPLSSRDCEKFISDKDGYDYVSASQELAFILDGRDIGRSPFLAIYESPKSPYSSMVLSLGELSPDALRVLTHSWPELITKVYKYGKEVDPIDGKIDPVAGIGAMLLFDPKLKQAQSDAKWGYMKIGLTGAICGGAFTASTITLNTLIATPACSKFILEAADAFGYTVPENMSKMLRS